MATLLEDLTKYFINCNLATEVGKDIWYDYDPDEPAQAIIIQEYDSKSNSVVCNDASVRYVQITARDVSSTWASSKAWQIYKYLMSIDNVIHLDNRWLMFSIKNSPIKIKNDSKQRIVYGFNLFMTTNFD